MIEKANIILDASKIDLFETCPRRYFYRYVAKRGLPVGQKNKSLDLGGLGHEGLAVYYRMLAKGDHYKERIEACTTKIMETAANPELSNSDPDDVIRLVRAIEESQDHWRAEDENGLEVLAVEQPFAYILYEDEYVRIIISGKIDLLGNYKPIGQRTEYKNLPFDHKTYSKDSQFSVLRKSNQFTNYADAVKSNYLCVNRIGLQDPDAKKPMTADEKFKRPILSYDPIYFQDWKHNITKMILNEFLTCVSDNYWPEKSTSCNKFNRLCEYYDVCDSSGEKSKIWKLECNYVNVEDWDVTKTLAEEKK